MGGLRARTDPSQRPEGAGVSYRFFSAALEAARRAAMAAAMERFALACREERLPPPQKRYREFPDAHTTDVTADVCAARHPAQGAVRAPNCGCNRCPLWLDTMARRRATQRTSKPSADTPVPRLPAREVNAMDATPHGASPFRHAVLIVLGVCATIVLATAWRNRVRPPPEAHAPPTEEAAAHPTESPSVDDDHPGTPGILLRTPRELPEPVELPRDDRCAEAHRGWLFPEMTRERVAAMFRTAGFDEGMRARLLAATTCEASMCRTNPDDTTLLELPSEARGRMYRMLGRYNGAMFSAIPFRRPLRFGPWEALPGLPEVVRDLLRRTTWREDGVEYFVDLPLACARIPDPLAREALLRALDRRYTIEVSVRPPPGVPLDQLARYWSGGRSREEVRAVFELATARHEGVVPLRHLLPPMPRRRLDTYRGLHEPPYDCFWTALHFFDEDAERASPPGTEGFLEALATHWREVDRNSLRFGDMIVFFEGSAPIHAVTLLAEDLVFTKNGGHGRRPWVVMTLDEVKRDYVLARTERYYRRRTH